MIIQNIRNNVHGAFSYKKGFTLVEIIVVLVILAILAAILVPKLTGWIDESKSKTAIGEAHLVLSALQSYGSEAYSNGTLRSQGTDAVPQANKYLDGDLKLIQGGNMGYFHIFPENGAVEHFTYVSTNGKTVEYRNGNFVVK